MKLKSKERKGAIKNLKSLSFRDKIQYIWDYFKFHILVVFVVIGLVIMLLTNHSNYVKANLYCLIFNDSSNTALEEHLISTYSEYSGIEPDTISIDSRYVFSLEDENGIIWPEQGSSVNYLRAQATGEADVIITDYDSMLWAKYVNFLAPVDEILPEDLYKQLEPYFVYAVFENDSDETGDGKVYGLDISKTEIYQGHSLKYEDAIVCLPNVSENPEAAINFIKYLYGIK